jgi:hypothetical protein
MQGGLAGGVVGRVRVCVSLVEGSRFRDGCGEREGVAAAALPLASRGALPRADLHSWLCGSLLGSAGLCLLCLLCLLHPGPLCPPWEVASHSAAAPPWPCRPRGAARGCRPSLPLPGRRRQSRLHHRCSGSNHMPPDALQASPRCALRRQPPLLRAAWATPPALPARPFTHQKAVSGLSRCPPRRPGVCGGRRRDQEDGVPRRGGRRWGADAPAGMNPAAGTGQQARHGRSNRSGAGSTSFRAYATPCQPRLCTPLPPTTAYLLKVVVRLQRCTQEHCRRKGGTHVMLGSTRAWVACRHRAATACREAAAHF